MRKERTNLLRAGAVILLALLCAACGSKEKAAAMQLAKTEGTVNISDEEGKDIPAKDNMMLYSGYGFETMKESYAWMNLDKVKLAKMDEASRAEIRKEGNELELLVHSGKLYFNITEPLGADESMNIRNSTMTVGIRGTCGWVEVADEKHMKVYILEGKVECGAEEASGNVTAEKVSSWEMAEMALTDDGKAEITVKSFGRPDIPEFVWAELDEELKDQIPEEAAETEEPEKEADEKEEPEEPEAIDYASYLGGYTCSANGASMEIRENGDLYGISLERPAAGEKIVVELTAGTRESGFYTVIQGREWSLTPEGGQLILEGDIEGFDGVYQRN